jgi:hypothetical protein
MLYVYLWCRNCEHVDEIIIVGCAVCLNSLMDLPKTGLFRWVRGDELW